MSDSDSFVVEDDVVEVENPYNIKAQRLQPSQTSGKFLTSKGQLVYFFNQPDDPAELAVFRKICMKYGLQAWNEMLLYLPWRTRSSLRTTLCRILKKQALSEYCGIRADPFEIQKDNNHMKEGEEKSGYKMKAGMLVNLKWNRSKQDIIKIQEDNRRKYEIPEEEADKIEIPLIISLEFMRQQLERRRSSVTLYRAAHISEAKRRNIALINDLQVDDLLMLQSERLCLPKTSLTCKISFDNKYVRKLDQNDPLFF